MRPSRNPLAAFCPQHRRESAPADVLVPAGAAVPVRAPAFPAGKFREWRITAEPGAFAAAACLSWGTTGPGAWIEIRAADGGAVIASWRGACGPVVSNATAVLRIVASSPAATWTGLEFVAAAATEHVVRPGETLRDTMNASHAARLWRAVGGGVAATPVAGAPQLRQPSIAVGALGAAVGSPMQGWGSSGEPSATAAAPDGGLVAVCVNGTDTGAWGFAVEVRGIKPAAVNAGGRSASVWLSASAPTRWPPSAVARGAAVSPGPKASHPGELAILSAPEGLGLMLDCGAVEGASPVVQVWSGLQADPSALKATITSESECRARRVLVGSRFAIVRAAGGTSINATAVVVLPLRPEPGPDGILVTALARLSAGAEWPARAVFAAPSSGWPFPAAAAVVGNASTDGASLELLDAGGAPVWTCRQMGHCKSQSAAAAGAAVSMSVRGPSDTAEAVVIGGALVGATVSSFGTAVNLTAASGMPATLLVGLPAGAENVVVGPARMPVGHVAGAAIADAADVAGQHGSQAARPQRQALAASGATARENGSRRGTRGLAVTSSLHRLANCTGGPCVGRIGPVEPVTSTGVVVVTLAAGAPAAGRAESVAEASFPIVVASDTNVVSVAPGNLPQEGIEAMVGGAWVLWPGVETSATLTCSALDGTMAVATGPAQALKVVFDGTCNGAPGVAVRGAVPVVAAGLGMFIGTLTRNAPPAPVPRDECWFAGVVTLAVAGALVVLGVVSSALRASRLCRRPQVQDNVETRLLGSQFGGGSLGAETLATAPKHTGGLARASGSLQDASRDRELPKGRAAAAVAASPAAAGDGSRAFRHRTGSCDIDAPSGCERSDLCVVLLELNPLWAHCFSIDARLCCRPWRPTPGVDRRRRVAAWHMALQAVLLLALLLAGAFLTGKLLLLAWVLGVQSSARQTAYAWQGRRTRCVWTCVAAFSAAGMLATSSYLGYLGAASVMGSGCSLRMTMASAAALAACVLPTCLGIVAVVSWTPAGDEGRA